MSFLSSRMRARMASFAVACAVWLSASSVPLQSEAAPSSAVAQVLTQFKTPRNENVQFHRLADGSVLVTRGLTASSVPYGRADSPLALYNELARGQRVPALLDQANTNFLDARKAVGSLKRVVGSNKVARATIPRLQPKLASQSWFTRDFCYPPGASYSACYVPAWSWAYLNSSGDSYGHAVSYAINAPLQFTVDGTTWRIPAGQGLEVWVFGFLFNFQASVSNAQYFDFESDVVYTF